jgi:excisionase family DNA binding protein
LPPPASGGFESGALGFDDLLQVVVEKLAEAVASRLGEQQAAPDRWLTTREAAEHLGMHPDTLRRLAAARTIACEQDGRGCALHFRLADLDRWRREGGPRVPSPRSEASTRLPRPEKVP